MISKKYMQIRKKPRLCQTEPFVFMLEGLSLAYSLSFLANLVLANFLLNLSIRPAVSTNFILPVKKGCDLLDISNFINFEFKIPISTYLN